MKKLTQPEETMIVKNAMELTATIMLEQNELKKVKAETFRNSPNPPMRKVLSPPSDIRPQYPPRPKTTYSYNEHLKEMIGKHKKHFLLAGIAAIIIFILGTLLAGSVFIYIGLSLLVFLFPLLLILALILSYCSYSTKRNILNNQLAKSPEYLQSVEKARKEAETKQKELTDNFRQEQEKLDAEYEKNKRYYEDVTIPEYTKELNSWKTAQKRKMAFLEEELGYNKEALNNLYDATKLISITYRDLWILKWLYEDMSTSDHDIRYATELLDRNRQRLVTEEAGKRTSNTIEAMENTMKNGFNAVYNAIEYGNELQEDSINILSKTRRDNNVGNLIGTIQRHHTNKTLDALLPKK